MPKTKKEKNINFDRFTPIEILWNDSCDPNNKDKVWLDDEEIRKLSTGFEIYTIGYITLYDPETEVIRVSRSYAPGDMQQEGAFDIPLGCIKDIKILKGMKKKKNKKVEILIEAEE